MRIASPVQIVVIRTGVIQRFPEVLRLPASLPEAAHNLSSIEREVFGGKEAGGVLAARILRTRLFRIGF